MLYIKQFFLGGHIVSSGPGIDANGKLYTGFLEDLFDNGGGGSLYLAFFLEIVWSSMFRNDIKMHFRSDRKRDG
jgi:hypothetical protein